MLGEQKARLSIAALAFARSEPVVESRRLQRVALWSAVAAVLVVTFWLHAFYIVPNHDNLLMLLGASRLVHGGRFYYDIFDPNPPLIFILLEPVAILAKLTRLDPYIVFSAWACLLALWSTIEVTPLLFRLFESRRLAGTFAVWAYICVLCLLPGYQFGQREHVSIILLCPWLFRLGLEEGGRPEPLRFSSLATTVMAAVGFLMKPYFVLLPVGILLLRALERRSWRVLVSVDTIVFVTISLLYFVTVILVFPEWFVVARLALITYRFLDNPISKVIEAFASPLLLVVAGLAIGRLFRIAEPFRKLLRYLVVATVLLFICAVAQHKTWNYHNLPTLILMPIVLIVLALAIWPSLIRMHTASRIAAIVPMASIFTMGVLVVWPWFASNCESRTTFLAKEFPRTLAELAGRRTAVVAITTWSTDVVFSTVSLLDEQWSSRTAAQWLVPGIVELSQGNQPDRMRALTLSNLWRRQMTEDLDRYRPLVVAVRTADDHSAFAMQRGFDILQLLLEDAGFRRSWAAYRRARVTENWTFYVRQPEIKRLREAKESGKSAKH